MWVESGRNREAPLRPGLNNSARDILPPLILISRPVPNTGRLIFLLSL